MVMVSPLWKEAPSDVLSVPVERHTRGGEGKRKVRGEERGGGERREEEGRGEERDGDGLPIIGKQVFSS